MMEHVSTVTSSRDALLASLHRPGPTVLIGAYDALSALLIQERRADGIYIGGYAVAASAYGLPDVGVVSRQEMLSVYERVAHVARVPLVVDLDAGYGSLPALRQAVLHLKRLGIAGFHVEDQREPKRCGHFALKAVVPMEEATARIRAAVDASGTDGPLVIARTDALQPEGLASAIRRCQAYRDAGAHATFVDAVDSVASIEAIRSAVEGPLLFNAASTNRSPTLSSAELRALGISVVIHPIELLRAAIGAAGEQLARIMETGVAESPAWPSFDQLNELLGLWELADWEDTMLSGNREVETK